MLFNNDLQGKVKIFLWCKETGLTVISLGYGSKPEFGLLPAGHL